MRTWLRRDAGLASLGWAHGWTTTAGPDFGDDPNEEAQAVAMALLASAAGLEAAAWARQVHGGTVLRADGPACVGEADAVWTDRPGLGVAGRSADCPLVLVAMAGPRPMWGFAHASWRSTVRGISAGLVATMADAGGDPATGRAVICPSAGPCCYEVGAEVREEACRRLGPRASAHFAPHGERWIMDLWSANREQLLGAGLPGASVSTIGQCTICCEEYPSYRRQGARAGRFAAIIGRPA